MKREHLSQIFRLDCTNNKIYGYTKYVVAYNKKSPTELVFHDVHMEKNCFAQFSKRIYWNRSLATFELFHMFTKSIEFYTFHCNILKSSDVWKGDLTERV